MCLHRLTKRAKSVTSLGKHGVVTWLKVTVDKGIGMCGSQSLRVIRKDINMIVEVVVFRIGGHNHLGVLEYRVLIEHRGHYNTEYTIT